MLVRLIVRRVIFLIFVLIGLSLITFTLSRLVPADPARMIAGPRANSRTLEQIRERYGLNDSVAEQYVTYMRNVVQLDFGDSFSTRRPVRDDLGRYLPATLELGLYAFLFSTLIGIPLGVISAVKRDSWVDHISRFISITGLALPVFWLALMVQFFFFSRLHWLPDGQRLPSSVEPPPSITSLYTIDALLTGQWSTFVTAWEHLAMPVAVLTYGSLAVVTRMVRGGMIEVLSQDYIRTARAKGLENNVVVTRHAVKNALLPTVTQLGLQVGLLLSGAFLVELVFSWPGIGRYTVEAIQQIDYNAIMATTLLIAVIFVMMNLVVDVLYLFLDPRIDYT
jgi:peptide/nickel transport system permease protein